jgi:acyl CoA:acetate/3-ketoacid CoA transferase beta subunit
VAANGDLANWSVPGMTGGGIGGAMDLAALTPMGVSVADRVPIMQECWGD